MLSIESAGYRQGCSDFFDVKFLAPGHAGAGEFLANVVERAFVGQAGHLQDVFTEH